MSDDRAGAPLLIPAAEAVRRALNSPALDPYPRLAAMQVAPCVGPNRRKGVLLAFVIELGPLRGQRLELTMPMHMPALDLAALLRGTADSITKAVEALPTAAQDAHAQPDPTGPAQPPCKPA